MHLPTECCTVYLPAHEWQHNSPCMNRRAEANKMAFLLVPTLLRKRLNSSTLYNAHWPYDSPSSVLAFHWSLGEQPFKAESVGIGYAGLAAALDRMTKGRSVMGINKAKSLEQTNSGASAARLRGVLASAVQGRNHKLLEQLLDTGVLPGLGEHIHPLNEAVHRHDFEGKTPLLVAVDESKRTGLSLDSGAIRDNRGDILTLLLERGANPNVIASVYPTWKCIIHNRLHFLPTLVDAGADLFEPPGLVELAVQFNNIEALKWLVEQGGVNVNDRNAQGHTALTTAIRENRSEMLSYLLAHRANPAQRGQDWPVCMAVRSPTILQKLLPMVPDLSAHKVIIEMAVLANQLESIKLLLAAGASVK
ncbi:ankyrin repeat domain-containing protein [Aspergillus ibericus CBS 121593]|uniref:Ankyrin n=1 Tax=Aspergillus ibericus CBS 121593 TaxID=1448316 RepID=A0A395GYW6_9EURO|nr:ankyrin [Aspergillus ibericus CBS 121593]RAL00777.1 ankyrin [Aspergillus ibericus CBS 121593]